jgi:hypothetical protein
MALAKLAPKCRACPKVLICDHKEMKMYGFLPIPEGGFDNPDVDIVAGVDVDGLYPTLPDALKQTLTRIMEERSCS